MRNSAPAGYKLTRQIEFIYYLGWLLSIVISAMVIFIAQLDCFVLLLCCWYFLWKLDLMYQEIFPVSFKDYLSTQEWA